jgi:hypothetical protein
MTDTITNEAPKKATKRKYIAIRKFGTDNGTVFVGDVVELTAAEAKHLNKHNALKPFIEDDEE